MGTGGYVGETRVACGHTLWSSAWTGEAWPPFVQQGCPWVERSEPEISLVATIILRKQ